MHTLYYQERRISVEEKLLEIYKNSNGNKYIKVKLKDGRNVECKADTFCTVADDEDEDKDITALSIIHKDGFREVVTDDDIEEVVV